MKYRTDTQLSPVCVCMSTETSAPRTETEVGTELSIVPKEISDIVLVVPVLTGAFLVLGGSLFLLLASPAPGSIVFGAVAVTMVGAVVGGFVVSVALFAASFAGVVSEGVRGVTVLDR